MRKIKQIVCSFVLMMAVNSVVQAQYTTFNTDAAKRNEEIIKKNNSMGITNANRKLAAEFLNGLLNARDIPYVATKTSPDIVFRTSFGSVLTGIEGGLSKLPGALDKIFEGFSVEFDDMVVEGNKVFLKVIFRGNHSSAYLMPTATGKPFKVDGFIRLIMADGKVSQGFVVADFAQIPNQVK
jgi:predicted ester cyclase